VLGLEYPSIQLLVEWPEFFNEGAWYGFNKITLINVLAVVLTACIFLIGNKKSLVPHGMRNLAETAVDFLDKGVLQQAIGPGGEKYLPFVAAIFFYVFFGNIFEVIPTFQMPGNARMATPIFLGVMTLVFFVAVGLKRRTDRVPLDVYRAAVLAGGPALRQHARRSHPHRDLRRVDRRTLGIKPVANHRALLLFHAGRHDWL
jgi:hypothetical protein